MSKTVLVTGASRGIGKAIVLEFFHRGYKVIANYNKSEKEAFLLPNEILKIKADVSNKNEVAVMFSKIGPTDILVNNAGVSLYKVFQNVGENEWKKLFGVNVEGVFNCCKYAVKHMIERKSGSIVNISSVWGMYGAAAEAHYSASKGAVIAFTKALAKELGPSGIRVNCVAPGVIETHMNSNLNAKEQTKLTDCTPLGRFGTPCDVAETVVFFAEAQFITGQIIAVDGGFVL
jgi:3-oxoacyl-[acyl-carrier protein] reductase